MTFSICHIARLDFRRIGPRSESAKHSSLVVQCDALEEEFTDEQDGFIPIFLLRFVQVPYLTGLVLRQMAPSVYSRIGVFSSRQGEIEPQSGDWFEEPSTFGESELRTISIV